MRNAPASSHLSMTRISFSNKDASLLPQCAIQILFLPTMPRDPFLNQSQDHGGPQMPQLKAGQRLFNRRYELLRPLGAGAGRCLAISASKLMQIAVKQRHLPRPRFEKWRGFTLFVSA